MARLGRTYSQSHLQRPQVVFAPAAPTQQQQTIKVVRFGADSRRRSEVRRFPPQWMESATIKETGFSTAGIRGTFERGIGPDPPQVIKALPPQWLQAIRVKLAADYRRRTEVRCFPLQGWGAQVAFRSSSVTEFDSLQRGEPARRLGPRPPTRYLAVPSQRAQTIGVALAVQHRRRTEVRRFPPQWSEPAQIRTTGPTPETWGTAERALGPDPPQLILPLPTDQQTTLSVFCTAVSVRTMAEKSRRGIGSRLGAPTQVLPVPPLVIEHDHRKGHKRGHVPIETLLRRRTLATTTIIGPGIGPGSRVFPPILSAAAQVFAPIEVTLAHSTRRAPRSRLSGPTVLQTFSGPSVAPAGRTRLETGKRAPHSFLGEPTVLQEFAGPVETEVAVRTPVEQRRHAPHSKLLPPQVVRVPSVEQQEQTIRVVLAGRTRVESGRRVPRSQYFKAVTYPATSEIAVALGGRTRTEAQRRAPHSRLNPPTTLRTFAGPVEEEIAVKTPLERPRRLPHFKLGAPTVVIPLPALKQQTIQVTLAGRTRSEVGRRAPHSKNIVPFFYPATSRITVWLAGRTRLEQTRRAPRARLAPPTTLQEFAGPVETEVAVRTPVEQRRHAPHSKLLPPQVVRVPSVEQQEQTIRVVLAGRTRLESGRRAPHARLTSISYPAISKIAVALAGRTRTEAQRRASHSRLSPPTVLQTFRGPIETEIAVRTLLERPRHLPHSHLSPPITLRVFAGPVETEIAVRTPTEQRRHAPHSKLSAPTVLVTFAGPVEAEVSVRTPVEQRRHAPHSRLFPPQIVREQLEQIKVTLAGRTRTESDRRAPHSRLLQAVSYPATSEIAITLAGRTRSETSRRAPHSLLSPPTTLLTFAGPVESEIAVRTPLERPRHAPHSRLRPPPVVATPPGVRQTLTVLLAGRTRNELPKRAPHSRLFPPVAVTPFVPPVAVGGGVGGSGFSPIVDRWRRLLEAQGWVEADRLAAMSDEQVMEEIIVLQMMGLL